MEDELLYNSQQSQGISETTLIFRKCFLGNR